MDVTSLGGMDVTSWLAGWLAGRPTLVFFFFSLLVFGRKSQVVAAAPREVTDI